MSSAKDVVLAFVNAKDGRAFIEKNHYSGKVAASGMFYIGCFLNDVLVGCFQYGRPIDKYKVMGLVKDTKWHDFLELNRLVFIDDTPKNTESRSIAMSFNLIKRHWPHIKWILSFADACQCGSGTIYRASGFHLTAIKKNSSLIQFENGKVLHHKVFNSGAYSSEMKGFMASGLKTWQEYAIKKYGKFKKLPGYQIRYIKLLYPDLKLNCNSIHYSMLDELDFPDKVRHQKRVASKDIVAAGFHSAEGGENPTATLQD